MGYDDSAPALYVFELCRDETLEQTWTGKAQGRGISVFFDFAVCANRQSVCRESVGVRSEGNQVRSDHPSILFWRSRNEADLPLVEESCAAATPRRKDTQKTKPHLYLEN